MITGRDLIAWGHAPGAWFPLAIAAARAAEAAGGDAAAVRTAAEAHAPPPQATLPLRPAGEGGFMTLMLATQEGDVENIAKVQAHMREILRLPTVVAGAVLPDACPSDARLGTIPVGGVAATREAIHPGMHSADICCSVAISYLGKTDPLAVLNAGAVATHFGPGGRSGVHEFDMGRWLRDKFENNALLAPHAYLGQQHFATQGDGNHFLFVGVSKRTGETAIVTHHGSRGPGAKLYKAGMALAEKTRRAVSPETPAHNAWIPSETREGEAYWDALQILRYWTRSSHYAIHDKIASMLGARVTGRHWNEHNFVFRRSDGLFYHAKGATPAWPDFASDSNGLTLVPLNMAEPILVTEGGDCDAALSFSPHGAGRNFSRTEYLRRCGSATAAELAAAQAPRVDTRWFSGVPDPSELPGAYKNAAEVRRQIAHFGLATVVDTIEPYGSIMAGDWQRDAPWRRKKEVRND